MSEGLFDKETGELIEPVDHCAHCSATDKEMRRLRTLNTKLKRRLAGTYDDSPRKAEIEEVFGYWLERHGKREDTKLDEDRASKINARLKDGYTVEQLQEAIDGCLLDDWAMGRLNKARKGGYHDIGDHICDRAATVERFRDLLHAPKKEEKPKLQVVPKDPLPHVSPLDRVLVILRREYGSEAYAPWLNSDDSARVDCWSGRCPLDETSAHVLRIHEPSWAARPQFTCSAGCLPSLIREGLVRLEREQVERLLAAQAEHDLERQGRDPFRERQAA